MRIKLKFDLKGKTLPIHHQHLINSFIHKCIGPNNEYHDAKNDYSISSMQNGKIVIGDTKVDTHLRFDNDGYITISSLDNKLINDILFGAYNTKFNGHINVNGIEMMDEVFYNGWNHFSTLSPFIIKEYSDKKTYKFLTLNDVDFETKVKSYLINKISKINPLLNLEDFDVKIKQHPSHKVKKIFVKHIPNLANQCQISIHCKKDVAILLYNIGIGQSTGSGFGTIYKTENHKLYRN